MRKITIVGDIICDGEMLKAAKNRNGKYCFDDMFSPLVGYFRDSDFVVGNLESSIANQYYTNSVFSFNNPEELVASLKKIGINVLSLANNHILDRGIVGLEETIQAVEDSGIQYFGIKNRNFYINNEDISVALLSYTDSTNYHVNKCLAKEHIYLLKPQNVPVHRKKGNFVSRIYRKLNPNIRININNFFKIKIKPIIDRCSEFDELKDYIEPLKNNIKNCKKNGYYTIMYPHMGGQYNLEPGEYVLKMTDKFKKWGSDSVVITHPHIIQKMSLKKDFYCFYSIGGMVISPTSKFVLWETKPQYSIVLNYYFEKKKMIKITCSFLTCIKDKDSYLKVYPLSKYYEGCNNKEKIKIKKEFIEVYNRLFSTSLDDVDIKDEYII